MKEILEPLENLSKISNIVENIKNKTMPIVISGLPNDGKAQVLSVISKKVKKPICIITYNEIQARELIKGIEKFSDKIRFFPKREIAAYDFTAESKDLPYKRIGILNQIKENKVDIIVTTIETIMQKMILPKELYKNSIKLNLGDSYQINELKENLVKLGYERNEIIDGRGQFSIRGGIVDVSISDESGVRIEFWGDDIDSIRRFNITTQRSTEMLNKISIYPSHEMILDIPVQQVCERIKTTGYTDKNNIDEDIELIKIGDYINKIDKYFNGFYEKQGSFLDYLTNFVVFVDEHTKINQRIDTLIKENNNLIKVLLEKKRTISDSIRNFSDYKYNLDELQKVYLERNDIPSKEIMELLKDDQYEYNFSDIKFEPAELEKREPRKRKR